MHFIIEITLDAKSLAEEIPGYIFPFLFSIPLVLMLFMLLKI